MSKIELVVYSLEKKVQKILYELTKLKKDNSTLKHQLNDVKAENFKLLHSLQEKESDYDTLKFANSILGSDENKRETKLKINSLVKQIDDCISKLSD
ncbi:hypothetical protein OAT58_01870 [Flavobacteriaceae bacterium]|jgi:predicted nuclease with TOPRIM domain|nr:hypothetical protein [Flavobacteriaceae bacterium]MDC0382129.1 hypothetical protein [Flavobacteriaceae bacterium]MDC3198778.1 hypothetical protein [Flavobacteriaceae bacterium]|tara:strand:- start:330 stop:620 length:291 start_codon:yes stop_codon:yes gene_type:complete